MGAAGSKRPAWPPQWFDIPVNVVPSVHQKVRGIVQLPPDVFLGHTAKHKDLLASPWPFEEYSPYCMATVEYEPEVSAYAGKFIPKRCSEAEFWRCYFCNLYTNLRNLIAQEALNMDLLARQDDATSNAVISLFCSQSDFLTLSQTEATGILRRDKEDDEKLAVGIDFARAKGVIPQVVEVEPTTVIDVHGLSSDDVVERILGKLGEAPNKGCVVVLHGLSGTGKGTTVSKLQAKLPNASSWSNGNLFRALTLLVVTDCEQQGATVGPEALTPERLASYVQMLSFGPVDDAPGQYDIHIQGLGLNHFVSEIANTVLKEPRIGKHVPLVAQFTQGEVINFAAAATARMSAAGCNVLMEGRAQTLQYVRTPHRFELTLKDPIIIGMRRAAQRMVAHVTQQYKAQPSRPEPSVEEIVTDLEAALAQMVAPP